MNNAAATHPAIRDALSLIQDGGIDIAGNTALDIINDKIEDATIECERAGRIDAEAGRSSEIGDGGEYEMAVVNLSQLLIIRQAIS